MLYLLYGRTKDVQGCLAASKVFLVLLMLFCVFNCLHTFLGGQVYVLLEGVARSVRSPCKIFVDAVGTC